MIEYTDLAHNGFFEYTNESGMIVWVNPQKQCTLIPNGEGYIPYYGPVWLKKCQLPGIMITEVEQLKQILSSH